MREDRYGVFHEIFFRSQHQIVQEQRRIDDGLARSFNIRRVIGDDERSVRCIDVERRLWKALARQICIHFRGVD